MPTEITTFIDLSREEQTSTLGRNPHYVPPVPPAKGFFANLFRRSVQSIEPVNSIPEFCEYVTHHYYPLTYPFDAIPTPLTRWSYIVPRGPDLFGFSNDFSGSMMTDSNLTLRELRESEGIGTLMSGDIEVTTVMPRDVADKLMDSTMERPAISRHLAHELLRLCVGSELERTNAARLPGLYAKTPREHRMRVMRMERIGEGSGSPIKSVATVQLGSDVISEA